MPAKSQVRCLFRLLSNKVSDFFETMDQIVMEGIRFCLLY